MRIPTQAEIQFTQKWTINQLFDSTTHINLQNRLMVCSDGERRQPNLSATDNHPNPHQTIYCGAVRCQKVDDNSMDNNYIMLNSSWVPGSHYGEQKQARLVISDVGQKLLFAIGVIDHPPMTPTQNVYYRIDDQPLSSWSTHSYVCGDDFNDHRQLNYFCKATPINELDQLLDQLAAGLQLRVWFTESVGIDRMYTFNISELNAELWRS